MTTLDAGLFVQPRRHVLIAGPPRSGKTTLICDVARRLGHGRLGFYSEEIRERGRRVGFRLVTLDGQRAVLALKGQPAEFRVGSYGVDVDGLESLVLPLVERMLAQTRVVLIDEIGKMECHSERFREAIRRLLDDGPPTLATVPIGGTPFIRAVKSRADTQVIGLVAEDRAAWPGRLVAAIRACEA